MLNLKKGLALVLAAATAFTFAPVANLGVSAYADTSSVSVVNATLDVPGGAFTGSGVSKTISNTSRSGEIGYTNFKQNKNVSGLEVSDLKIQTKKAKAVFRLVSDVPSGLYPYIKADGLYKGQTELKDSTNHWVESNSTYESYTRTQWDTVGTLTANTYMKNHAYVQADADGIINLGQFWITSAGAKTFSLAQQGSTALENITVTINIPDNKLAQAPAYTINQTSTVTGGVAQVDDEVLPQSGTYPLKLNTYKPGYAIQYTDATPKYTDWAGNEHTITYVDLYATNRSIQWVTEPAGTATAKKTVNGTKTSVADGEWEYSTAAKKIVTVSTPAVGKEQNDSDGVKIDTTRVNNDKLSGKPTALFKTTAATFTQDSLKAVYHSDEGSSEGNVDFATDRSDNAIDAVYDNGKEVTKNATGDFILPDKDAQINNAGTITVKTESPTLYYRAVDPSIIQIDSATGEYKILKKGDTRILVFTSQTLNNNATAATIWVHVNPWATDQITLKDSQNALWTRTEDNDSLDLDVPTQTAKQAVKTDVITATSKGGLTVLWKSDNPSVATVDEKTGEVKAVAEGITTLHAYTKDNLTKEVYGTDKAVQVQVWTLPASIFTFSDVTVEVNKEVSLFDKTTVAEPDKDYSIKYDYGKTDSSQYYSLTNVLYNYGNTQSTSKLTGKKIGTSKVQATVLGISGKYRPTTHVANVTVLDKSLVPTITLDDASKSLNLNVGDTAQLKGTVSNGKTVEFSTKDTTVVSVTSGGAITALAAGKATVVASADGADSVEIPVLVSDNNNAVQPAAVTGLKVSNKKGAYVSVKWASQGKNINYRIWKKVGNGKWIGKNVAGSKTTLSVKKGAKVQVKVKAYVKDSTGKTTWGPKATKAKTFKTDKK